MQYLTSSHISYPFYQIKHFDCSRSDLGIIDRINLMDILPFSNKNIRLFYKNLNFLFQTDSSSIRPNFEIKNETALNKEILDIEIRENMLEFDIFVQMPAKKEQFARVRMKSVEKATPNIIEPNGF